MADAFARSIFLFILLAKLLPADGESWLVREQENAFIKALKAKDKAALLTLTDKNFHVSLTIGSAVRYVSTDVGREDWIEDVTGSQIDAYQAVILKMPLVSRNQVFVAVDEAWTLRSAGGSRIEKRFSTQDSWIKVQGTWKLAGRLSHSDPP